jgi:hypothetical protein
MIVCAAVGAVIAHAVEENAALRAGEIQGVEARRIEDIRWKGLTPREWESVARGASHAESLAQVWKWRIMWGAIGGFVLLRRKYLWAAVTKRAGSRFWAFIHAFSGADWTRKRAGFDLVRKKGK